MSLTVQAGNGVRGVTPTVTLSYRDDVAHCMGNRAWEVMEVPLSLWYYPHNQFLYDDVN